QRHEVGRPPSLAPAPDVARDILGISSVRVLSVGDDEKVLTEHTGPVEIRTCLAHRLPNGSAAARPRQAGERGANRRAIVRLYRPLHPHATGKTVDANLDREIR